ncbi:hypothetical protein K2X33_16575 [bacterium]|nr:hypothetical protein [bacterium]
MRLRWILLALAIAPVGHAEVAEPVVVPRPVRFEVAPQISVLSIAELTFPSAGVQTTRRYSGFPCIGLNFAKPLGGFGDFSFALQATAAFGSRGGAMTVVQAGEPPSNQDSSVTWIPLTVSTRLQYRIPNITFFRPSLTVGLGALTVIQRAALATLSHTSVVPSLVISPQVTFMDSTTFHWLGGFSFGATFYRGLGGNTALNATSLDLGLNILL